MLLALSYLVFILQVRDNEVNIYLKIQLMSDSISTPSFIAHIVRTKRVRTIGIKILQGRVVVNVPNRLPLADIENLVLRKRRWIEKKLGEQAVNSSQHNKCYRHGETVTYLGEQYMLHITQQHHSNIYLDHQRCQLRISVANGLDSHDYLLDILTDWYKQMALAHLSQRVEHFAPMVGAWPKQVKVRRCKSRWGSCSTLGNINFNWLLIMAPPAVVDYVVVHELCHLIEHNHSPRFWQLVALVMPGYQQHWEWLKQHGQSLTL